MALKPNIAAISPKSAIDLCAKYGNAVFNLRAEIERVEADWIAWCAGDKRINDAVIIRKRQHPAYQAAKRFLIDHYQDPISGNTAAHLAALAENPDETKFRILHREYEPLFLNNAAGESPLDILNHRNLNLPLQEFVARLVQIQQQILNDAMLVIRHGADAVFEDPTIPQRWPAPVP